MLRKPFLRQRGGVAVRPDNFPPLYGTGPQREPQTMDLNEFLGPKPIVIDLHAQNRWEAIDELINHLVANHKIKPEHRNAIAESVRKRESSMTTGIGFGIGVPHAATDLVS